MKRKRLHERMALRGTIIAGPYAHWLKRGLPGDLFEKRHMKEAACGTRATRANAMDDAGIAPMMRVGCPTGACEARWPARRVAWLTSRQLCRPRRSTRDRYAGHAAKFRSQGLELVGTVKLRLEFVSWCDQPDLAAIVEPDGTGHSSSRHDRDVGGDSSSGSPLCTRQPSTWGRHG